MMAIARNRFPNYLELPVRVPLPVWWIVRCLTFAGTLGLIALLLRRPQIGLDVFWKLAIPVLPLTFAVLPGLWRQVCPMAFTNQLPRALGFSRNLTLPAWAKTSAYIGAVVLFFGAVIMRRIVFNTSADALAALLIAALVFPYLGGVIFKGRSGWCGTICPLSPLQRAYGQAPVVMVRNGYCPSCLGCQKNCYDFNPRAAVHSDLGDSDPWYSGHREFFVGALPGLLLGYFTTGGPANLGVPGYLAGMASWIAISLGAYMALSRLLKISRYKATLLFSMGAFAIFYWFSVPVFLSGLAEFSPLRLTAWTPYHPFFAAVVVLVAIILRNGLVSETAFAGLKAPAEPRVGVQMEKLRSAGAPTGQGDVVHDRGSGRSFAVDPDQSLLEGLESAGANIDFGCRIGVCGADPIAVIEGHDCLSAPNASELDTLDRLGLRGRARLACVTHALKPGVTLDTKLDPTTLPEPTPAAPRVDLALASGVKRIVIIGNGAAGTTTAEEIRRLSPSCNIEIVARERDRFYNRMAIGRLLYGRAAMAGLFLNHPDWATNKDIALWYNTSARRIDREAHEVVLGTDERLKYDKLILAQGSQAVMPPIPGSKLPGCFVLREADNAIAIRAFRQHHQCRTAVVIGGGVLGIEAADALRRLNLSVTVLQRSERLMDRQLDAKGAAILQRYLEGLGGTVLTGASTARCIGDERLTGIELADGTIIDADIMVACAGIHPNMELAAQAGLAVNRGVIVDTAMYTSDPDILAVGDVAELPGSVSGLWAISTAQGKVAAASVFGQVAEYREPNSMVNLKMDGIDVKSFGIIAPSEPTHELIVDAADSENEHRLVVVEGGRLLGALVVGPPGTGKHVAEIIERRPDLTPVVCNLRAGNWSALHELAAIN
jgi:NADPH-dependent 2,4-dienoyl-CoA reductase/sulfur reductase-like enzyme/ferredoxin